MKKFTFKTEQPTGSYRSFFPDVHYIKLNKKRVGSISDREWKIRLMVEKKDVLEDGNPNCDWQWISLKKQSKTLQEAKNFLNENIERILELYELHYSE